MPKKMAKRRVVQRKPHFVKVLFGDFSKQLRIPPNFVKHFSGGYSRRAILEGPTGGIWPVELQRTTTGMYLSGGWQNFVKDNTLHEFEFLLFRYEGGMHFSVSIFDTSACEREDLLTDKNSSSYTKGLRKWGRPRKCPQEFGSHMQADECRIECTNSLNSDIRGCYQSLGRCLQLTHPDVEIKIEQDELPICAIGFLPSLPPISPSSNGHTISQGEHWPTRIRHCSQSQTDQCTSRARGFCSQRRPVSLQERERSYEAARSFTSNVPFCIVSMKISSVYRTFLQRIPAPFARMHLPRTKTELVLEDPTERRWPVIYIPQIDSRLSGGWAAFARSNNLEEGDFCVFELVRPLELRVHIFRLVEEIMPLIKAQ